MNTEKTHSKYSRIRTYIKKRNEFYSFVQKVLTRIKSFDQLFVIIIAIMIGVISGYGAAGFRKLIDFFKIIFWGDGVFVDLVRTAPLYMKLAVPAIGGLIVALIVKRFAPEAKGHGVPEVMNAVATLHGFIRMRVVFVKSLASALSIGSGAAVGREGPIVQIGSAFGSMVGQFFQVSSRRMKMFVGCGAAAGIAATFNAPIAGAIFASEVLLGDFSVVAVGPIIISSVFATVVSRSIYGNFPAFIPPTYVLNSPKELIFYIFLGMTAGLGGWLFVKTLYFTEDIFDQSKLPTAVRAILGGVLLGVLSIYLPETLGVGYETMDMVLAGNMTLFLTIALLLGKIFATSLSLGYGASGGIFAPSLFMGSMLGGAFGNMLQTIYPDMITSPGAYALVGMAAMVAATTHAPITAILIIFEMTAEYTVILPLMISSIIATVITSRLLDGNIYTIKLKRRGIDIHSGAAINVLDRLQVDKLKKQFLEIIHEDTSINDLLQKMSNSNQLVYYVCNPDHKLIGIITQGMVRRFINRMEEIPPEAKAADICNKQFPAVYDHYPVHEVLRTMLDADLLAVPVIDSEGTLTGQVLHQDILKEYHEILIQNQSAGFLASSMKFIHKHYQEKSEVITGFLIARINTPSEFVRLQIKELQIRDNYNVFILLVRKNQNGKFIDLIPSPTTMIEKEDQLIIFGNTNDVNRVCELL